MGISFTARFASLLLLTSAVAVHSQTDSANVIKPPSEAESLFEGTEMITRWTDQRGDGVTATAVNRYTLLTKNRLKIVSTYQVGDEPAEVIGTLIGSRQR